jgi:hypothetical protein
MYVADREGQRLFGIYVGVPGATEFATIGPSERHRETDIAHPE